MLRKCYDIQDLGFPHTQRNVLSAARHLMLLKMYYIVYCFARSETMQFGKRVGPPAFRRELLPAKLVLGSTKLHGTAFQ